MKKTSLQTALLVPVVVALLVSTALVAGTITALSANALRGTFNERVNQAIQVLEKDWSDRRAVLEATIAWFSNSGRAIQILNSKDHAGGVEFGKLAMQSFRTDFFVLADAQGTVLARAHAPDQWGDSIAPQPTIQSALTKKAVVALEEEKGVQLALRGAVPILSTKGDLVGVASTGFTLSQESYVDGLKAQLGAEITIFGGDLRLMTTLVGADGKRIVGTKLNNPVIEKQVLQQGEPYYGTNQIRGVNYVSVYLPIRNDDTQVVGMLFAGLPLTSVDQATELLLVVAGGLTVVLLLVTSLLLIVYLRRTIIRPLVITATDLQTMAQGAHPDLDSSRLNRTDEIGGMTRSLEDLADYLAAGTQVALAIASGNFDVAPRIMGPEDRFGQAFVAMTQDLNELVRHIRQSATSVAAGIRQLAEGTAGLSSGASESAASLEEMGSSLTEIVRASQDNAAEARQAVSLANQVNQGGQESQAEMDNLLKAMDAIEASARDIQGVVKTIDDIAFQVNLLALNANIEAARAGKYGKGFGVVAEEVRSLARRSAEAVHQTNQMVKEVQTRIGRGTTAARHTNGQLVKMTEQIHQITGVLGQVADRSLRQSETLGQLNEGMGQLSQVTQNTAATAEESASVTQELKAIAQSLETTTERFQVKGG